MGRKQIILFTLIINILNLNVLAYNSAFLQADSTIVVSQDISTKLELVEQIKNSDIKQAILYAKEALHQSELINNKRYIAESKLAIGKCYEYLGVNIEALEHLTDALHIFNQLDDKIKKASTLRQIGNIYYALREYTIAQNYFNDVYLCGVKNKDTLLIIEALIGKGSVYGNTNRLDSAMIIFNQTYQLAKALGDKPTEVQSLFYIGDVYLFTDKPLMAIEIFNQVEKNYKLEVINSKLLSSLYNSMTHAYLKINNLEKAKYYNSKVWETLQIYPRINHLMGYYQYKFRIDTTEKNYQSAVQNYIRFKNLSDSINDIKFKERLANFETLYDLAKKEGEIERLTLDNELKDISIKQRKILNYGSLTLVILLFIIVFQILKTTKRIKFKNRMLQEQQEELATANEELVATNEELHNQRDEMEAVLTNLQNTQKQLIQAEKMASLGVLAAGVAHEINNPLNFIKGGIVGIEDYIKENFNSHYEQLAPLIDGINVGVGRAASIVTSLNHYSRKDDLPLTNCDIHFIIDNCLLMIQNQIKNRIEIIKDYTHKPYQLISGESKLHQVILNILINAAQAIKDKGTIKINTKIENNTLEIIISDTGCGIPEENIDKILDPFFTTKEPGKGTGLGLSITYNILQEINGNISFKSKKEKGTTVTIKLPLTKTR